MRGRKPTPVEIKELEGNPGKRPLPEPVRVQGRKALQMPEGLPEDARAAWEIIVPPLMEVGLLDGMDAIALEAMCVAYARMKEAQRILNREGSLSLGSKGQPVEHPAVQMERQSALVLLRYAEQYAMTPVARTRLGMAELQRRTMVEEMRDRIGASPRVID